METPTATSDSGYVNKWLDFSFPGDEYEKVRKDLRGTDGSDLLILSKSDLMDLYGSRGVIVYNRLHKEERCAPSTFGVNGPILPLGKYFYVARKNVYKELLEQIRSSMEITCLMFYGPRAYGKTSLLFNLSYHCDVEVFYADCSTIDDQSSLASQLCWKLFGESWQSLNQLEYFFRKPTESKKTRILVLDEFETIFKLDSEEVDNLLILIRSMKQRPDAYYLHSIIIAGTFSILDAEIKNIRAPPFNVKSNKFLSPPFTLEETKELFDIFQKECGKNIDEEIISEIHSFCSGCPGLVNLCGRFIQKNMNDFRMNHFGFKEWKKLFSSGGLKLQIESYPSTGSVLKNFEKNCDEPSWKSAKALIVEMHWKGENEITGWSDDQRIKILAQEGILRNTMYNDFSWSSRFTRDILCLSFMTSSKIPKYKPIMEVESLLLGIIPCFLKSRIESAYDLANKQSGVNDETKPNTANVPKEAVYHHEFVSVLQTWISKYQLDRFWTVMVDAPDKEVDIFLHSREEVILFQLLANCPVKNGNNIPQSWKGTIEKANSYHTILKSKETCVLHFIATEKSKFPETYDQHWDNAYPDIIQCVIFHDQWNDVRMFIKYNENEKGIDLIADGIVLEKPKQM